MANRAVHGHAGRGAKSLIAGLKQCLTHPVHQWVGGDKSAAGPSRVVPVAQPVMAYAWLEGQAIGGDQMIGKIRDTLAEHMPRRQIALPLETKTGD